MITQHRRILIVYASPYGSTRGIAGAIKKELGQKNTIVETKLIKDVIDLDRYDAVIIGSPIQYDRWMPEAKAFVTTPKNQNAKGKYIQTIYETHSPGLSHWQSGNFRAYWT